MPKGGNLWHFHNKLRTLLTIGLTENVKGAGGVVVGLGNPRIIIIQIRSSITGLRLKLGGAMV